ncbi:hypothetical protein HON22_00635, partial [Candidatus Peregrinibacteria bacterium]|nr:hypothetical protein [Candidatus Peregrinibacteria bacterium]
MPKIQAQKSALQRFKQSIIILFQNPLPLFSIPFLGVLAVSATEMLIPTDLHISSLESIHDLSMITIPEIASWLVNLIMPFVIGGIVMASFIYALDDIYKGKKADLKESLNFGVRKLGDYAMVLWDIFIYTALIPLIGITILSITLFFLPSFL